MSEFQEYRHARTGKIGTYRPEFAARFPRLIPTSAVIETAPAIDAGFIDPDTGFADSVEPDPAPAKSKDKR